MARIFISYRRDQDAGYAGWLCGLLNDHFGDHEVFRDIDDIEPGADFVQVIDDEMRQCDAVIVLIGPNWLTIQDDKGGRRLDNPEDFVRREIAAALARNVRVIPALVRDAVMPGPHELPAPLRALARRNALQLSDARFKEDVSRLVSALEHALRKPAIGPSSNDDPPPVMAPATTGGSRRRGRLPTDRELQKTIGSRPSDSENSRNAVTLNSSIFLADPDCAGPVVDEHGARARHEEGPLEVPGESEDIRPYIARQVTMVGKINAMKQGAARNHAVEDLREYEQAHGLKAHHFHFEGRAALIRRIERMQAGKYRERAVAELRAYEEAHGMAPHHFRFEAHRR